MSSKGNVKITLEAVDKASNTIKQVSGKFRGLGDTLKDVGKIAAGVLVRDLANNMSRAFEESAKLGGEIGTLEASFNKLVEATGATNVSLEKLREATKNTVSNVDLLTAANTALTLGVPTDKLNELFEAAMKLGHAVGQDTTKSIEDLTTALGRQSNKILDNLGVVFQASDAYAWYAQKIGKSVDELTESEKKLGWQQYAISQVMEKASLLGDNISDVQLKQEQWNASMENFKTAVGKALGPISGFVGAIEPMLPMINTLGMTLIPTLIQQYGLAGLASKAFAAAQAVLNAVMNANPIMLVVTALAALTAGLVWAYYNVKPFHDAVDGVAKLLGEGLYRAVETVKGALQWVWDHVLKPLADFLKNVFGKAVEGVANAINAITHPLETLQNIGKGVTDWLGDVKKALFGSPQTIFEDAAVGVEKLHRTMKRLGPIGLGGLGLPSNLTIPTATQNVTVQINSPLVNIEGSADKRTAELAADLVEKKLKTVLIESTSSAAPTKRIRITRR